MMGAWARVLAGCALVTALGAPVIAGGETIAVVGGQVITMAGAPVDGGTVLIEDGKIRAVGREVKIPPAATVIDASGSVVMPGLVDANARYGVRGDPNEESSEITPAFSVLEAIDRDSREFRWAVQLGVTTVHIAPGNANVITGRGAVVKSAGRSIGGVVVGETNELKVMMGNDSTSGNRIPWGRRPDSFYYRQPTTRMGVVWLLRKALAEVQSALEEGEQLDEGQQVIAAGLKGRTPVSVSLRSAVDIETTFTIADEFGLKNLVFLECTEGYKAAKEIARRKVPVVLGPFYQFPRNWPEASEGWDVSWNNAGLLAEAGVKVALASNDPGGPTDLLLWAALAVRNGMAAEEALKAVTVNPATILGVADRVGSLAKGKDADLLILSGDPLDVKTRIEKVIVGGEIAFDAGSGADADG